MSKLINLRILLSFITLLFAAVIIIGATSAFFSDTETSKENVLGAGAIDLKIDNRSYITNSDGILVDSPDTSWTLTDLIDHKFFNFADIKPGDIGEDTISIHVDDNDAWACMNMTLTKDDDVDCNEPELIDDPSCTDPGVPGNTNSLDGELGSLLNFVFWTDDGDNVLEVGEKIIATGFASSVLNSKFALADSITNNVGGLPGDPLIGTKDYFIGKAWCFGTLTQNPVAPGGNSPLVNSGILCDGSSINNASQTDSLMGDISFSAVQYRNNPDFTCDGTTPSITPTITPTPTVTACSQADVMLVLDRSGSINVTELTQLKTAANAFVTSLGLTPLGIHAGQTSFATLGTLDQILTSNPASLTTSINGLVATGFTNLKSGIDLAAAELTGINDRADGTSPDKMIVITDGNPNRPLPEGTADDVAAASATAFKGAGGEVFVVGVGGDVNTAYLQGIATNNSHYYSAANYSGLQTALENLDLCQ